jgi:large subunit ribosomal protein L5
MTRLNEKYNDVIKPKMVEAHGYTNTMQVPRIEKIVINMGVGEAAKDSKLINGAVTDMTAIAGQKPVVTKAKKSIANYKLREGMDLGVKVTLRKARMYEFLDRMVNVAMPRIRDFQGVSGKSFDGRGNFAMGFKEQIVFPEIEYDQVDQVRGMDVIIVTTAKTDAEAKTLLAEFGIPFRN